LIAHRFPVLGTRARLAEAPANACLTLPKKGVRSPRRGLAAVEMAIIAPVLVFLTIGMLELARGMMVKEVLTDAARKGCRTGILPTGTSAKVTADINAILTNNNINANYATIKILVNGAAADVSTSKASDKISVRVAVTVSQVAWITPMFLPAADIESETVTMMSQK
jgi:Flp pilus assembly protein TadG